MEAGSVNPSSKTDNTIDASDSPVFDDTEVCTFIKICIIILKYFNSKYIFALI